MPSPEPPLPGPADELEIRRAGPDDLPAVVELAGAALGWSPGDPNQDLFRWKHLENPAGPSPMWVALEQGRMVGLRVFLRWRFVGPDGRTWRAVRAVDTATHPSAQGRGIFTRLTSAALDELAADGVDFVFNTPNDQSRPGYLKMGWQVVGRVPIAVRPRGPSGALAMARARVPAAKWSLPTAAGRPASDLLADSDAVNELLGRMVIAGLATDRSAEHLQWRYRFAPLHYRALAAPAGAAHGLAVFRLRARGRAREATVCELLAPDATTARILLGQIGAATGADYLIAVVPTRSARSRRLVPLPGQGPILTWRAVARDQALGPDGAAGPDGADGPDGSGDAGRTAAPALADWDLSLGDIELF